MGRFVVPMEESDEEILAASITNLQLALEDAKAGVPRKKYQYLLAFANYGIRRLMEKDDE